LLIRLPRVRTRVGRFRGGCDSGTIQGRDRQSATNDVCSVPRLIAPELSALVAQLNSFLLGKYHKASPGTGAAVEFWPEHERQSRSQVRAAPLRCLVPNDRPRVSQHCLAVLGCIFSEAFSSSSHSNRENDEKAGCARQITFQALAYCDSGPRMLKQFELLQRHPGNPRWQRNLRRTGPAGWHGSHHRGAVHFRQSLHGH